MRCEEGKYKVGKGSEACTECPEHTESPFASISKDSCICKEGFEGPNGGPCLVRSWKPQPRPPTLPSDVIVAMSVSMPLMLHDFKEEQQSLFRTGVANVATVDVSSVYIASIEPITTQRRSLMAGSIKISVEIRCDDLATSTSMSEGITVENLNAEFHQLGLPSVQILESPVVLQPLAVAESENDGDGRVLSSSADPPWLIIAMSGVVVFILILGTLFFLKVRKCCRKESVVERKGILAMNRRSPHQDQPCLLLHVKGFNSFQMLPSKTVQAKFLFGEGWKFVRLRLKKTSCANPYH